MLLFSPIESRHSSYLFIIFSNPILCCVKMFPYNRCIFVICIVAKLGLTWVICLHCTSSLVSDVAKSENMLNILNIQKLVKLLVRSLKVFNCFQYEPKSKGICRGRLFFGHFAVPRLRLVAAARPQDFL